MTGLLAPIPQLQRKIQANSFLPALARGFMRGTFSRSAVESYFRRFATLYTLGLDTNAYCNLSCEYCYLDKYNSLSTPKYVDIGIVEQRLTEFAEHNPDLDLVALVGKEPFADQRGIRILEFLDRLSKGGTQFRYGVVTNGTLLEQYVDRIPRSIAYIDVSLDGPAHLTNRWRGSGVFERATKNMRTLVDLGFEVWTSSVLHSDANAESDLYPFIKFLATEIGCHNFYFSPVRNFTGSLSSFLLSYRDLLRIQREIVHIGESVGEVNRIILDHPYEAVWRDYIACSAEDAKLDLLVVDGYGNILEQLNQRVFRKLDVFPHSAWATARVDAAGDFLWDVESRTYARPEVVGNIKNNSILNLHQAAVAQYLPCMLERFLSNMQVAMTDPEKSKALRNTSLPILP